MGEATPRPGRFTTGKDTQQRFVQDAGWAQVPVYTGGENIAPTGIRFLDRPGRSESDTWYLFLEIRTL